MDRSNSNRTIWVLLITAYMYRIVARFSSLLHVTYLNYGTGIRVTHAFLWTWGHDSVGLLCNLMFFFVNLFITHSGGGISSYAGQQGAAGKSLEACLDQAVKDIPKDRHQLTPVYLGATAGMRLLRWVTLSVFVFILPCFSNVIPCGVYKTSWSPN